MVPHSSVSAGWGVARSRHVNCQVTLALSFMLGGGCMQTLLPGIRTARPSNFATPAVIDDGTAAVFLQQTPVC